MDWSSAALLREIEMIDDIMFVHPKDMQDGLIEITSRDITHESAVRRVPAICALIIITVKSCEMETPIRQNYVLDS